MTTRNSVRFGRDPAYCASDINKVMGISSMRAPCIVLALIAVTLQTALAAGPQALPTAKAENVGMSTERLTRLSEGMKSLVDQGRLAGVVSMVAPRGNVIKFEAIGNPDIAANLPMHNAHIFRLYSM